MADKEWFRVESPAGAVYGPDYASKDLAVAAARGLLEVGEYPILMVVKYSRREVCAFTRTITINETGIPSA